MNLKKAALINAAGRYIKIILTIIVNAILARLLSPEDYGIVAIVTVFSTFFSTFSDMGFGTAVIQNKGLKEIDINNIFSFTVYVALFLSILFGLCSYPISLFYGNEIYIPLGLLLSIALFFNALNMVPNGILNRYKKFLIIAIRTIIVYAISGIISIILAYMGFRYYALVIQSILSAVFTFIWNYLTLKLKFYFNFNFNSVKKVLNYSEFQFGFNVVNYFSRNLDRLLVGKLMGSVEVGYYNRAYTLMLYPVTNLTGVISPVLHPILSDFQNHLNVIYVKYMKVLKLLACTAIYVAPVCYLAGYEIINIVYGPNWQKSVACFQILSIAIITQMMNSSAGAIFQAIGNTKLLFINSCINTGITVSGILIGVFWGNSIKALSLCVCIAYIIHFITAFTMLIKLGFHYKLKKFLNELFPEIIILGFMVLAVLVYPFKIEPIFVSLLVKCLYLGVIFILGLLISKEYKLFFLIIKKQESKNMDQ